MPDKQEIKKIETLKKSIDGYQKDIASKTDLLAKSDGQVLMLNQKINVYFFLVHINKIFLNFLINLNLFLLHFLVEYEPFLKLFLQQFVEFSKYFFNNNTRVSE